MSEKIKQETPPAMANNKPVATYPEPKPDDIETPEFNAVWEAIKSWDINVPEAYEGYCSATGNHVIAILIGLGLRNAQDYTAPPPRPPQD